MELSDALYHACRQPKRARCSYAEDAAGAAARQAEHIQEDVPESDVVSSDVSAPNEKARRRSFIVSKEDELGKRALEAQKTNTPPGKSKARKGLEHTLNCMR